MTAAPWALPSATSSRAVARRRRRCSRFGEAGERVVQGLVAQLTHELAVAQRDAGLVRDGLQQEDVVLVEAADVLDPVGHDQRADDAGLAAERHDDGVLHAVGGQPPARLGVAGAAGHEQRGSLGHHLPEHREVFGVGRVLGPGEAPTGPEPDAGDDAAVGGHEGGRGPLGTQQFPRLPEQSAHDLLGLGEVLTASLKR